MNRTITLSLIALLAAAAIIGCSKSTSPTYSAQPPAGPVATVVTASGDIAAKVTEFRTLIGNPANGAAVGQQPAGRREVSWDGATARPFNNSNNFPPDFFNTTATVGLVYANDAFRNDSSQFVDINPTYANEFKAFTPKVMFSAIGAHVINAHFQVAGAATPAAVSGFGAVFVDVDTDNASAIELFDKNGASLGRYVAPRRSDVNGLSFVGVKFDAAIVASVRITCGTGALGVGVNDVSSGGTLDLVVIDNVIYGEPNAF